MKEILFVQAINEALEEELNRDEKVYIIGEDVQAGTFGVTTGLVHKFGPERIMDTPLSETVIAGAAVGSAMTGYRPVAEFMFADFMYVAGDEIFAKAAKWRFIHGGNQQLPLVFMASMGGYAKLGAEHSQSPESMFMHTPGLKLVVPSTPYDAKGLMKSAIRDNNPVVYLFHKRLLGLKGEIPEEEYVVPLGQADVKREGTDITVVATGMMVHFALSVAKEMEEKVSVEVIDPRSLEPLDIETIIESIKKTGRAIIVDEDTKRCGVASEIMAQIMELAFDYLDAPIQRVAAKNYPIPSGFLEDYVLPQTSDIKAAIEAVAG
ncbi:MAG: alpha-ketoacid dehydrogenase subunit beta [Deltaproteobacteria bacterium]|nr:alpha-ketoacid dehydrogenase subunit beta [Deltaproteobacteria bacterium]